MRTFTLKIKDNKTALFLEALIGIIPSIEIEGAKKRVESKLLEELKEAVKEMKEIKAGKRTAQDAEDFLNEL